MLIMINIFLVLLFCVLILYCAFMISVILLKFKFRSNFFSYIFWLTFLLLLSFFFNFDHQKAQCYMWFCSTRDKGMESGMQDQIRSHSQCCLVMQQCLILQRPLGLQPARFLCPWDFPGKSTGVGCHFLLQGILLTQGLNLSLLHGRQILYN